jgi:hypothetical protein
VRKTDPKIALYEITDGSREYLENPPEETEAEKEEKLGAKTVE